MCEMSSSKGTLLDSFFLFLSEGMLFKWRMFSNLDFHKGTLLSSLISERLVPKYSGKRISQHSTIDLLIFKIKKKDLI